MMKYDNNALKHNNKAGNPSPHFLSNKFEDKNFLRTALKWTGSVSPIIMPRVLISGLYSLFIYYLHIEFPFIFLDITPFEYTGAVLGVLLVARVNAGMGRWWEARKIWGSIVNQSRNLAIIASQYSPSNVKHLNRFLGYVALWPHTMREHLRNQRSLEHSQSFLELDDVNEVKNYPHMPLYVGTKLADLLNKLQANGLSQFAFLRAERERALLIDAIGACERIKNTPIPYVMAIKTRRFIFFFLLLLPFAFKLKLGLMGPFIMCLTSYPLFSLDQIGIELQDPFSKNNLSHLPLDEICKNIQGNVEQIRSSIRENSKEDDYDLRNKDEIRNKNLQM